MIRRAGSVYKHIHEGKVMGTHKRKADALAHDNAMKLVIAAQKAGITRKK